MSISRGPVKSITRTIEQESSSEDEATLEQAQRDLRDAVVTQLGRDFVAAEDAEQVILDVRTENEKLSDAVAGLQERVMHASESEYANDPEAKERLVAEFARDMPENAMAAGQQATDLFQLQMRNRELVSEIEKLEKTLLMVKTTQQNGQTINLADIADAIAAEEKAGKNVLDKQEVPEDVVDMRKEVVKYQKLLNHLRKCWWENRQNANISDSSKRVRAAHDMVHKLAKETAEKAVTNPTSLLPDVDSYPTIKEMGATFVGLSERVGGRQFGEAKTQHKKFGIWGDKDVMLASGAPPQKEGSDSKRKYFPKTPLSHVFARESPAERFNTMKIAIDAARRQAQEVVDHDDAKELSEKTLADVSIAFDRHGSRLSKLAKHARPMKWTKASQLYESAYRENKRREIIEKHDLRLDFAAATSKRTHFSQVDAKKARPSVLKKKASLKVEPTGSRTLKFMSTDDTRFMSNPT